MTSGPVSAASTWSASDSQLGLRVGRHQGGDRAQLARPRERAADVRRAPGRGEPDSDVAGAQARGLGAAGLLVVLDVLDGPQQGGRAAGVVGDEQARPAR